MSLSLFSVVAWYFIVASVTPFLRSRSAVRSNVIFLSIFVGISASLLNGSFRYCDEYEYLYADIVSWTFCIQILNNVMGNLIYCNYFELQYIRLPITSFRISWISNFGLLYKFLYGSVTRSFLRHVWFLGSYTLPFL